jgi:antitoxin HicB
MHDSILYQRLAPPDSLHCQTLYHFWYILEAGYEMKKRNKHIGSSLDDFLKEEGVLEETRAIALKETLAWQVQQAMEKDKISKAEMARRMNTSRAALDRLLDPKNASVTLQTLTRAAHAIGRDLRIELV